MADYFNATISEWHLGKDDDGSWLDNRRLIHEEDHPCTISKQEFDELLILPSEYNNEEAVEESRVKRLKHVTALIKITQQHNTHKPNPLGPPQEKQKCAKKKPKKKAKLDTDSTYYCSKGYPKALRELGNEEVNQDTFRQKLFKIFLERNDQTLNNFNAAILLCLGANMDIQPVCTFDGLLLYLCKYLTKDDTNDIFRDIRDDTGRPTDNPQGQNINDMPPGANHIPGEKMLTRLCINL